MRRFYSGVRKAGIVMCGADDELAVAGWGFASELTFNTHGDSSSTLTDRAIVAVHRDWSASQLHSASRGEVLIIHSSLPCLGRNRPVATSALCFDGHSVVPIHDGPPLKGLVVI